MEIPSLSQQALRQDVTQYSAGKEHGPRRHNTASLSLFQIGLLEVGCLPWDPENPLQHQEVTRCQARPKQTAQEEAGGEGRRKMEQGKRNQFSLVETSLSLTMSAFKTKIKEAIPEKRKGVQVYTASCSTTSHSHPAMILHFHCPHKPHRPQPLSTEGCGSNRSHLPPTPLLRHPATISIA